jgi:hypothetical protein
MKYWKLSLVIGGLAVTTTCLSSSSIAYMLNVPAKGKVIEDFILAGWVLENQTAGDLNGLDRLVACLRDRSRAIRLS